MAIYQDFSAFYGPYTVLDPVLSLLCIQFILIATLMVKLKAKLEDNLGSMSKLFLEKLTSL